MRWLVRSALFLAPWASLPGQTPPVHPSPREAYDYAQAERAAAESLWSRGDSAGIARLHRALAWLELPQIQALFAWAYLAYRPLNIYNDLAAAWWRQGDTAAAVEAFWQAARQGQGARYVRSDSTLAAIAVLPAAARSTRLNEATDRIWRNQAFATPYRDTLPLDERLAGLALLWAEIRYGYVQLEEITGPDWDARFLEYLPRVRQAETTFDYYRVLEELVARVGDGHTNVYFPDSLTSRRYARPPIRTRRVAGQVLVTEIPSPSVAALGLRVGDRIERIDGVPVEDYVAATVRPYLSSSTPQDLEIRAYSYMLLAGPRDRPVTLDLEHAGGSRGRVTVVRTPYADAARRPLVRDSILPGGIGYLRVDDFGWDSIPHLLRAALGRLRQVRGLVVDVRWNGGGNTSYGYPVLRAIADRPFEEDRQRIRLYSSYYRASGIRPWYVDLPPGTVSPDTAARYTGPVVLLVGPMTFSAAEDFAAAWRTIGRGPIVGEPTGGSTGQPFFFPLPGGGSARVRTKWDRMPDGTEFNAIGIVPDVRVGPTVAGIRAGRDEMLEEAVRLLRAPPR